MFTLALKAHPGPDIVRDSKGNIYLQTCYMFGKFHHMVTRPKPYLVHTHQLYIDQNDVLFGEHL
ncbi:MAG: hypothetical protein SH818_07000 [Saprospiraceae bacterium]|nr:hypothetical protein [Saprospiraceae bacterium]